LLNKSTFFLLLVLLTPIVTVSSEIENEVKTFQKWLGQQNEKMGSCLPKKAGEVYKLCDQTEVSKKELASLFSMTAKDLISFLRSKDIKIEIYCNESSENGSLKTHTFSTFCKENTKRKSFKKSSLLQGQYLGRENTILLHSHALKGSLIHEYIHYLQFQNKKLLHNKRYKYERVQLESKIIKEMDQIIIDVQNEEAKKNRKQAYDKSKIGLGLKRMLSLSEGLKKFSFWQDLIDERNIFQLYLLFGHEFNVSAADISLAKKNMRHICGRSKIRRWLPKGQCKEEKVQLKSYIQSVKEVIREVRPKPNFDLVNKFLSSTPTIEGDLKAKVNQITNAIFKDWKMTADESYNSIGNADNILPDSTLKKGQAHCVGLSLLFLMMAEKQNLTANLIRIPGHVFIRACENRKCVDIEMLKNGKVVPEDYYFKTGRMTQKEVENNSYFTPIKGGKKLKSSIYLSLGYIASKNNQQKLAELFYKKSIDADRSFAEGYSNLASVYSLMGSFRQSKIYMKTSLAINPHHIPSLLNSAILSWKEKDESKAFKLLKKAQEINPYKAMIYFTRAKFLKEQKKASKEMTNIMTGLLIAPGNCKGYQRLLELKKTNENIKNKKNLVTFSKRMRADIKSIEKKSSAVCRD
jgi:hypothetical protein